MRDDLVWQHQACPPAQNSGVAVSACSGPSVLTFGLGSCIVSQGFRVLGVTNAHHTRMELRGWAGDI